MTALVPLDAALAGKKRGKVFVSGTILYEKRDCLSGPVRDEAPLAGAKLLLEPASGKRVVSRLDALGRFREKVGGRRPIKAFVDLHGARLSVRPDEGGSRPYRIRLGRLELGRSFGDNQIILRDIVQAGAANIWTVLNEGAEVAAEASPVRLQPVRALWRYESNLKDWVGSSSTRYVVAADPPVIRVGGKRVDGVAEHDGFESFGLAHEYGHHLLVTAAHPGPSAGGRHFATSVYRDQPALPWSEGFAHAFASVVLGNPEHTADCKPFINLGVAPATATERCCDWPPQPGGDGRFAQFNETAVAGVVWELVNRFGSGQPRAGLKPLLAALHAFHVRYGGPESMREARDALIEGALETSAAEHQTLNELFARNQIGWAFDIEVIGSEDATEGSDYVTLRADGPAPYGGCDSPGDEMPTGDYRVGFGTLDHAWQDDCYVAIAERSAYSNFNDLWVPYPSPTDRGNPEETFRVYGKWECDPANLDPSTCPSQREFEIFIDRGFLPADYDPTNPANGGFLPFLENWGASHHIASTTLSHGAWTALAEFDALGHCKSLIDGGDCGL